MWVYVQSEPSLYTVGFYDPAGKWHSDSDHEIRTGAANRAAFLNGARPPMARTVFVFQCRGTITVMDEFGDTPEKTVTIDFDDADENRCPVCRQEANFSESDTCENCGYDNRKDDDRDAIKVYMKMPPELRRQDDQNGGDEQ